MNEDSEELSTDDAVDMLADIEAEDVSEGIDNEEIAEAGPQPAEDDGDELELAHDTEDDDGGEVEPETPAIEAPLFLGEEGKQLFAQLSPEAQTLFAQVEEQRQIGVNRKLREASDAQKVAQERAQLFDQRLQQAEGFLTENERALAQYQGVDWVNEYSAVAGDPSALAEVQQHKAYYDQLVQSSQQAKQFIAGAERDELRKNLEQLDAELPELDPSLADPAKRVQAFQEVTSWAVSEGVIGQEDVPYITARQYALARDAMLYRKAKADAKSPKPKLDAKATGRGLKPGVTGQASSQKTSRRKQLAKKLTLSNAEAAELLADL